MSAEARPEPAPRTMKASEFKARCLGLMDEIAESGGEIVITKRGRPVARLAPYREGPRPFFGRGGPIVTRDDVAEPVAWEAEEGLLDGR